MGRPATGKTPVITFRPPGPLLERFDTLISEGRTRTDALIEAMHLWVERHEQQKSS